MLAEMQCSVPCGTNRSSKNPAPPQFQKFTPSRHLVWVRMGIFAPVKNHWARALQNQSTLKSYLINLLKFLLFLGFGLLILYFVYDRQNTAYQADCLLRGIEAADCSLAAKVLRDFRSINYYWILVVLLLFTISNLSRAWRWNMMLRSLGYRPRFINAFLAVVIGYFANLGLPRLGEFVRAATLSRYEKIRIEKVVGTMVIDRAIDVLAILIVTGLAFLLQFNTLMGFAQQHVSLGQGGNGGQVLLGLAAAGAVGTWLAWRYRAQLLRIGLVRKIASMAQGFAEGIKSVRHIANPGWFILHSVNIWLMYFLMVYVCFFAFAPTAHLSMVVALVVFVFGSWGVVIPSPGGMGTYHFLAQTALGMYGISGEDGFSWANISFFSIQLGCNVTLGLLGLLLLPIINRDYKPLRIDAPQKI